MERSFYLENFGCRATQADGAAIERQLLDKGLARAADSAAADVIVLNTCTVTSSADQDARATIRRIHRENPGAQILVTGCYAQRAPDEIAQIPGVSVVVGNSHKHQLAEIADRPTAFVPVQSLSAGEVFVGDIFAHTELMAAPVFDADTASEKTRPNLKVQDGCNNRCSFCIIPYVRGKSRSLRLDEVVRETQALVGLGYKEIVLSGINLGRWGRDLGARSLSQPAERALISSPALQRGVDGDSNPKSRSDDSIPHDLPRTPHGFESPRGFENVAPDVHVSPDRSENVAPHVHVAPHGSENVAPDVHVSPDRSENVAPHVSAGTAYAQISESGFSPTARLRFVDLLRAILAETDIAKIRISSVEPMDWSDDLIELVASSSRICKHAHVPLQSGSDRILRKMHRKYRPWHYSDRIQKIRAAMPTAAIGADVMVGFPGETDADFEETRAFIESLPFTYLHVFTYSSRPGTPSASMPNQVRGDVTRERNRILRELVAKKKRAFQEQFIGQELEAITLTNFENGRTEALTDNYQKLWLDGSHDSNLLVKPTIIGLDSDALIGTFPE